MASNIDETGRKGRTCQIRRNRLQAEIQTDEPRRPAGLGNLEHECRRLTIPPYAQIEQRLADLGFPALAQPLRQHVSAKLSDSVVQAVNNLPTVNALLAPATVSKPQQDQAHCCCAAACHQVPPPVLTTALLPSFSGLPVFSGMTCGMSKSAVTDLRQLVDALETAQFWCAASTYPAPKTLAVLRDLAVHWLSHFDKVLDQHRSRRDLLKKKLASGGHKRQRHARLLTRLAICMLRSLKPASGWTTKSQASEVIGQALAALAKSKGWSVSYDISTRVGFVQRLLWKDPRAAETFKQHQLRS